MEAAPDSYAARRSESLNNIIVVADEPRRLRACDAPPGPARSLSPPRAASDLQRLRVSPGRRPGGAGDASPTAPPRSPGGRAMSPVATSRSPRSPENGAPAPSRVRIVDRRVAEPRRPTAERVHLDRFAGTAARAPGAARSPAQAAVEPAAEPGTAVPPAERVPVVPPAAPPTATRQPPPAAAAAECPLPPAPAAPETPAAAAAPAAPETPAAAAAAPPPKRRIGDFRAGLLKAMVQPGVAEAAEAAAGGPGAAAATAAPAEAKAVDFHVAVLEELRSAVAEELEDRKAMGAPLHEHVKVLVEMLGDMREDLRELGLQVHVRVLRRLERELEAELAAPHPVARHLEALEVLRQRLEEELEQHIRR